MTRKCALCKETNYKKNNYSFFSAPKDAETRKKWQTALAIKNYTVTDDTHVCSKHFHKNDIITHWVSGVPPQVIKIKYKKCRLRPGAIPGRNFHSVNNLQSVNKDVLNSEIDVKDSLSLEKKQTLEENETFLIPRRNTNLCDNEDTDNKNTDIYYQTYSKSQDYVYNYEENDESDNIQLPQIKDMGKENIDVFVHDSKLKESKFEKQFESIKTFRHYNNISLDFTKVSTDSVSTDKEKNKKKEISDKTIHTKIFNKTMGCNIKRYDSFKENETSVEIQEHNVAFAHSCPKENLVDNSLNKIDDLCIENRVLPALNYQDLDTQDRVIFEQVNENEILFEDFLEVCTEVSIPRGWSCLVTSPEHHQKGHGITVIYLCMDVTRDGLPFIEKQIFIRSDMMLHYAIANKEIDPFMHNLVKERKYNKVTSLLDVEVLIDKFDKRVVCQGIYDLKNYGDIDINKIVHKDGIKWRHNSCPLIINNASSRCTKCTALSRMLLRKS